MKDFEAKWQRLAARARSAPVDADASAPYGFATRVASRAFTPRPVRSGLFEQFALRGLLAACALSAASVAYSFEALRGDPDEELAIASDPLPELLDLSS